MRDTASETARLARAGRQAEQVPSITVCLVTHNRPYYVRSCLDSLRVQTVGLDGFDVIVVDSCGTPETGAALREMVATLPNARLLRVDRPGASAARNMGAEHSTKDFLAYLDDDALAMPDWIERIQEVIQEHAPGPASSAARCCRSGRSRCPTGGRKACVACSRSSNGTEAASSAPRPSPPGLSPMA
ncbi:glycosyltransferase family 2 protein [Dankookia sp. P2]|uniref:glycosyltransferase family 2 protein n=1 Tax=Dankookia sp. P2 TaxID=3423955 RepID=UPI003D67A91A